MNIILLGLSGCGKTSTAQKLAEILDYHLIDLDGYIANKLQKDIPSIFKKNGENYFRKQESLALKEITNKFTNNTVLALGGGSFYDNNINICKQYGKTIWLNPTLDIIINRLTSVEIQKRPLLNNNLQDKNYLQQKLSYLLKIRKKYYAQADYCITINSKEHITNITNKIIGLIS